LPLIVAHRDREIIAELMPHTHQPSWSLASTG